MKNLKKLLSALVVISLLVVSYVVYAGAAGKYAYEKQAEKLHGIGLFKGKSTTEYQPDLGAKLTREEGITMLLRLIAKEGDALKLTDEEVNNALKNFEDKADVSDWAKKHVAYAVSNELVKGVSDTKLDPKGQLSGNMYATMILRNCDQKLDEDEWKNAVKKMKESGAKLSDDEVKKFDGVDQLTRDDAVGIAYASLYVKCADDEMVLMKLISKGVVSKENCSKNGVEFMTVLKVSVNSDMDEFVVKFTEDFNERDIDKVNVKLKLNDSEIDKGDYKVKFSGDRELKIINVKPDDKDDNATEFKKGTYTISIKINGVDYGTYEVKVGDQKVKKIEIASKKLYVIGNRIYGKYVLRDQHGNDITDKIDRKDILVESSAVGLNVVDQESGNKGAIILEGKDANDYVGKKVKISVAYKQDEDIDATATLTVSDINAVKTFKFEKIGDQYGARKDVFEVVKLVSGDYKTDKDVNVSYKIETKDGLEVKDASLFNKDMWDFELYDITNGKKDIPLAIVSENENYNKGFYAKFVTEDGEGKIKLGYNSNQEPPAKVRLVGKLKGVDSETASLDIYVKVKAEEKK